MTPAQQKAHLEKLLALHAELSGKGPRRIEPNRTDEARVGGDEDEQPLNEMLQAIASGRNRMDAVVLARVTRALRKLREEPEEFGVCEECDEDISPARLDAVPYAELCVACQRKKDALSKGTRTRKKLTDYS
jgi:DnaK suppressor protein